MYMFADFNFTGRYFFSGETFGKKYLPFVMGLPKWFDHVLVKKHVDGAPKMPSVFVCNTRNHESKYIYDHICIVTPLVLAAHLQMHIYIVVGYLHNFT